MKINVDFKAVAGFSNNLHTDNTINKYPFPAPSNGDFATGIETEFLSGKLLLIYGRETASDSYACLESILSTLLEKPILYADLPTNYRGKPYLLGSPLHFNLSRSNDAFLLGISRNGEIGVDLEKQVPPNEINSLAEYAFSPDERKLLEQQPSPESFLKIWTLKEAFLKATGIGLIDALPTLHVVSAPDFEMVDQKFSSLHFFCPGEEIGSLVFNGQVPEIIFLNYLKNHFE